jgi:hypothetical protein
VEGDRVVDSCRNARRVHSPPHFVTRVAFDHEQVINGLTI